MDEETPRTNELFELIGYQYCQITRLKRKLTGETVRADSYRESYYKVCGERDELYRENKKLKEERAKGAKS